MKPLMPGAVAIWLIDNTTLTFKQISDFCNMHVLEIEAIANGELYKNLVPVNPTLTGELTIENIKECENDPEKSLTYQESSFYNSLLKDTKKNTVIKQSKFKRKAKPEAILWMIKNYPDITDYSIAKLLGSTSTTVKNIRNKTYWNYKNITPKNPVNLSLCTEEKLLEVTSKSKAENKMEDTDSNIDNTQKN